MASHLGSYGAKSSTSRAKFEPSKMIDPNFRREAELFLEANYFNILFSPKASPLGIVSSGKVTPLPRLGHSVNWPCVYCKSLGMNRPSTWWRLVFTRAPLSTMEWVYIDAMNPEPFTKMLKGSLNDGLFWHGCKNLGIIGKRKRIKCSFVILFRPRRVTPH